MGVVMGFAPIGQRHVRTPPRADPPMTLRCKIGTLGRRRMTWKEGDGVEQPAAGNGRE
jgi:hypothetical protein